MQLQLPPSKLEVSLTDQIMSDACSILRPHAFPRVFVRGLHAHHCLQICVCLQTQAHHAPALADAALSKVLWSQGIVLDKFGLGYLMLLSNGSAAKLQVVQGGVVAAFGLVRGSAQADMLQLSVGNTFTPQLLAQVRHKACVFVVP